MSKFLGFLFYSYYRKLSSHARGGHVLGYRDAHHFGRARAYLISQAETAGILEEKKIALTCLFAGLSTWHWRRCQRRHAGAAAARRAGAHCPGQQDEGLPQVSILKQKNQNKTMFLRLLKKVPNMPVVAHLNSPPGARCTWSRPPPPSTAAPSSTSSASPASACSCTRVPARGALPHAPRGAGHR